MRSLTAILAAILVQLCFVETWQALIRCPNVRLPNGRVRARARGRIVRFSCNEGFNLVGSKYATCIRGKWDTPAPICINAECSPPSEPDHALVVSKYNGAILMYFCEAGYMLIGAPEIYCDGKQWNATAPFCRDTTTAPPTFCDFEKPDLCWWEQDPKHDFDWRRHNFETPSYHIGTGPTHDHTLGPGYDGYYLYIEASGRLVNDTARIVSPLYNASLSESGCFSFWYHMYGGTIGALRVYFKEETDGAPRLMFNKEGNQGNQWLHGQFDLPKSVADFQIIIEGVRGSGYVSDIAIDDVALLQGANCTVNTQAATPPVQTNDDQVEIVNAQQSCRDRCTGSATIATTETRCSCAIDCADYFSCCPDFAEYCVLGMTEDPSMNGTMETTGYDHPTMSTTTKVSGVPINPKDDIDPGMSPRFTTSTTITASKPKKSTYATIRPTAVTTKSYTFTRETPLVSSTNRSVSSRPSRVTQSAGTSTPTSVHQPEKLHSSTSRLDVLSIVELVAGILTAVSALAAIAFFAIKRRRGYKRGANGSALSEDSDVRFLTSDEVLDFNLARPSDHEESQTLQMN